MRRPKEKLRMSNEAFCQTCGQKCTPELLRRPAEDHDAGTGGKGMVNDWRSPCCHDKLSAEPVTDQCDQCGEVAARGAEFPVIDGTMLCLVCIARIGEG